MVRDVPLAGIGEDGPLEQLCLVFHPILLSVPFLSLGLRADLHVEIIGLLLGDDIKVRLLNLAQFTGIEASRERRRAIILNNLGCLLLYNTIKVNMGFIYD